MYRLKALIWKSYKVRARSRCSTSLDLLGPVVIVLIYLGAKVVLNQTNAPQLEDQTKDIKFFRNFKDAPLDISKVLGQHMCSKILYYSTGGGQNLAIQSTLQNECGFELMKSDSRLGLIEELRRSLDRRMHYRRTGSDLNQLNVTTDVCIRLQDQDTKPIYQIGLVHTETNEIEIHSTDFGGSGIVHMPYSQGAPYNEYKLPQSDLNMGLHLIEICIAKAFKRTAAANFTSIDNISWRFRPYPVITGIYVLPMTTTLAIMLGSFCTNIAIVLRISEANELGIHHYIRTTGLPACLYWIGLQTIVAVQVVVQSLLTSMLLAIPTGSYISDAISEASMTFRWMLIFIYSLASNSHATFIASIFDRSSKALLVLCTLSSMYAMYPLLLLVQWTTFGFTSFFPLNYIILCNPVSTFQAACQVMIAVALQTNQNFGWIHLHERIINGGMTHFSTGELLLFLLVQCMFWMLLTILIDQYRYTFSGSILGFLTSFVNELCCSNCLSADESNQLTEDLRTKTLASVKTTVSRLDPNRICCSLRHIDARGATIMMPYTKSNPLKFSHGQIWELRGSENDRPISKTTQYMINRNKAGASEPKARERPILLDEAITQNIVWYSATIKLENLDLDFRFNQISFVLGQTNQKELLFETILGLCSIDAGHMIIDGVKYTPGTLNLARRQIGYLGANDIFFNELTIFENLQFFGSLRQRTYKSYDSESLFLLNLLHLYSRRDTMPPYLTNRSARKLSLGVACVGHTKLLLLTEPTANLHWRPRCHVYNLLKKYKSIRSIVIDSSDVDEAVAFGDRIVLLKNGLANLNDTPARLEKRLGCGYWLVFSPSGGDGRSVNSEAIKWLEALTNDLFRGDKIDLETTRRSIYYRMQADTSSLAGAAPDQAASSKSQLKDEDIHRVITVLKVRQSAQSTKALCKLLQMFAAQSSVHGFRLAHLSYESLEDVLVLRMSRALYPDLPPDLLLSLQHRTQEGSKINEPSPVSVRRVSDYTAASAAIRAPRTIFSSGLAAVIRDRLSVRSEIITTAIALFVALLIIVATLIAMQNSLGIQDDRLTKSSTMGRPARHLDKKHNSNMVADTAIESIRWGNYSRLSKYGEAHRVHYKSLPFNIVERLYKYRVGFYILGKSNSSSSSAEDLSRWNGNKDIIGTIDLSREELLNQTDAQIVAKLVHQSRDVAGSFVAFNRQTNEATIIFEPYLPHMMMAGVKKFINFNLAPGTSARANPENAQGAPLANDLADGSATPYSTTVYYFHHPWHEMIKGFTNRRMIYGVGFALAESIAIGILVLAPTRHRNESRLAKVQTSYWFYMAVFDMIISLPLIVGYIILFMAIEGLNSVSLITILFIVLLLYKLASLPIPYTVSIATEYPWSGFLFILLVYMTVSWTFAIILRTFVEWTLMSNDYLYTLSNWVLFGLPISALIDSLTVINQVNNINRRCRDVPAYTRTVNRVELEGVRRLSIIDNLFDKVRECLASGKTSIDTNVLHQENLGIIWFISLMIVFGVIGWIFLLTCESFFGIVARRFNSTRTSADPMNTIVRVKDTTGSLFKWDKERDRLISEYIKCMNEIKHVKDMAANCVILRVWLKPMRDQTSLNRLLSSLLEPLFGMGHTKNEIQVELRTTLQIFIRVGDESQRCRVDKVHLIQAYTRYAELNADSVAKIAVVDWTRENLYKIVLHGHYNTKINTAI